jgi:uncharacterized protein (TIGR02996 family)
MTDAARFLAAIRAAPDDDAPRLVYADFLHENGEEDRAEFIRVQCRLARMERGVAGRGVNAHKADKKREGALLATHLYRWLAEDSPSGYIFLGSSPGDGYGFRFPDDDYELSKAITVLVRCSYVRGFIGEIETTAAAFLKHADALTAAHPVREVRLTTRAGSYGCEARARSGAGIVAHCPAGRGPTSGAFERTHLAAAQCLRLLKADWPGIEFELPAVRMYRNRGSHEHPDWHETTPPR